MCGAAAGCLDGGEVDVYGGGSGADRGADEPGEGRDPENGGKLILFTSLR